MSEENQILKYFKNQNKSKVEEKDLSLRADENNLSKLSDESTSSKSAKYAETTMKGNINSNGNDVSFKLNTLKKDLNKKSDSDIHKELSTRGSNFHDIVSKAMDSTISLAKDINNYDEKEGLVEGNINLTTHGDHGYYIKDVVGDIEDSLRTDNSFISNQVRYDKNGDLRGIGRNIEERVKNRVSGALTSSFESSVGGILNGLGLNITSSDYPFKGRGGMFGSLAFDPGSNSKYAIVIEEPDTKECAADSLNIRINNQRTISQPRHSVTDGSSMIGRFVSSFTNSLIGGAYPTCSPYKDIFPSGWVPCTGFSLEYGRILSENIGLSQEYQFEVPSSGIIAPSLTTEILEDNQQSVRRWLKDYMEFMSPYPGFVRPYKTCCCKVTVLTYNKQWSRDPGDVSDSLLNLVSMGNSQNKSNNFLKWVFYAYPSTNISYQSSPEMNIDSVTIQWNILGEKDTSTNVIGNLINKFI